MLELKNAWDKMIFVSHISVNATIQTIIVDKKEGKIVLENGYFDLEKVKIPCTEMLLLQLENCLMEMQFQLWPASSYNLGADGERWTMEFYLNDELIFSKTGLNAYPEGYGKWFEFYMDLFHENGIREVHSCYQKEREGLFSRFHR